MDWNTILANIEVTHEEEQRMKEEYEKFEKLINSDQPDESCQDL